MSPIELSWTAKNAEDVHIHQVYIKTRSIFKIEKKYATTDEIQFKFKMRKWK